MRMSPADDRKLVKVIECHHVLWDNRMKEFRDKMLTQHGWKSVSELLGREVDDVMCRWANLRKQYSRRITRLRQKGDNDSPEKPWHLMSLLSFLRPCITPRKRKNSSILNNSSTSAEEISSSSQSDDNRDSSPLVVRINPVEPPRNSLFYSNPEKKPGPRSSGLQRRPLRKLAPKPDTAKVFNLSFEESTTEDLSSFQMNEEQIDDPSTVLSPDIQLLEPNVHKLSSTPKAQCIGVKTPQTAIRSVPLKTKKLRTSFENVLPSFSKSSNASSETERKRKPLPNKTSATKSTNLSSETEKRPKISSEKPLSSVAKSTNASLETEKKMKLFAGNVLSHAKSFNVSMAAEKKPKTCTEDTISVAKSGNVSSEVLVHKAYDSDEHFLLSLASDFRKMDPRQKYECKIKMLSMVCEQYIKN